MRKIHYHPRVAAYYIPARESTFAMDKNELAATSLLKDHSGELLIFGLICLILITLLIALPQLLRQNLRKAEYYHLERMKAIEKGMVPSQDDERSRFAGRVAVLVPIIVMISAATVTSFLVVYKSENLFAVSLGIWVVAGVVSLSAITGGVALLGRLTSLELDDGEPAEEEPQDSSYTR